MLYWQLGPLAPDRPARLNDGFLRAADGVYPMPDGYRPVGGWELDFTALPEAVRGAAAFTNSQGVGSIIAGTTTNLYKAYGTGWQSIKAGFSTQGNQRWRFAQFGDVGIATNGADPMQEINLTSLTVTPLAGSPPRAEILAVVNDFLFAGVIDGNALQVRWSGRNDARWWTPAQRFSDFQTLPDGGRVNGILSGEYGIILQRNAIRRVDFVGGNTVFAFSVVSNNIGCLTVHSVAQWGRLGFFISDNGPCMWDGQQPMLIGDEEWASTFMSSYDVEDFAQMSTAVDPINSVVMWAMPDKIWCYNWRFRRASTIPYVAPIVFSGVTKGISVDEQDQAIGALDDDVDGVGLVSMDDATFKGGTPQFFVFSSSGALGQFSGSPMAATFVGNDLEMVSRRSTRLKWSRPDIDAASGISLAFLQKQTLASTGTSTSFSSLQSLGHIPTRVQARYLRPTVTISSGTSWNYARGVEFDFAAGNGR